MDSGKKNTLNTDLVIACKTQSRLIFRYVFWLKNQQVCFQFLNVPKFKEFRISNSHCIWKYINIFASLPHCLFDIKCLLGDCSSRQLEIKKKILFIDNKTGLQPVSRPVEPIHYLGVWSGGFKVGAVPKAPPNLFPNRICQIWSNVYVVWTHFIGF